MFHKKRKNSVPEKQEGTSELTAAQAEEQLKSKKASRKKAGGKAALFFVLLAAVAAAVLVIVLSVTGSEGMRKSQKLAKKIGEPVEKAESSAKIEMTDASDFSFINELYTFDSLAESERKTRVYDVSMPEWTIYCSEDSFGKLESVTYCDFRVLSSSINGIKKKNKIDTGQIVTGSTSAEVESILNMDPYQTVYSGSSVSKKYKYYYKDKQSGEIRAYIITVIFGKDNCVNSPVITEENNFIFDILRIDKD